MQTILIITWSWSDFVWTTSILFVFTSAASIFIASCSCRIIWTASVWWVLTITSFKIWSSCWIVIVWTAAEWWVKTTTFAIWTVSRCSFIWAATKLFFLTWCTVSGFACRFRCCCFNRRWISGPSFFTCSFLLFLCWFWSCGCCSCCCRCDDWTTWTKKKLDLNLEIFTLKSHISIITFVIGSFCFSFAIGCTTSEQTTLTQWIWTTFVVFACSSRYTIFTASIFGFFTCFWYGTSFIEWTGCGGFIVWTATECAFETCRWFFRSWFAFAWLLFLGNNCVQCIWCWSCSPQFIVICCIWTGTGWTIFFIYKW